MGDGRIDEGMIEIGDPAEEPMVPAPPPTVVIEYRDRGVPWMLVPPLLVISAVLAVVGYLAFDRKPRHDRGPIVASLAEPVERAGAEPTPTILQAPALPELPRIPIAPPAEVASDPAPVPVPVAEVPPFPRVPGLGFDPKALEADREPAAPVDPEIAPAVRDPRREEAAPVPDRAAGGPDREQPREVEPELLPPDPRLARARRDRWVAELKRQAEADRGKFHSELRAICKRLGMKGGPEIFNLCKTYGVDVDPVIKKQAADLLTVAAAGVDRPVRINLLRSLGFSESVILIDLYDHEGKHVNKASRDGPRSSGEVMFRSALILLSNPPTRAATPSRPVSSARPGAGNSVTPARASFGPVSTR